MHNLLLPLQLPHEIVSLILRNVDEKDLYNCTLINKQFYQEANPLLWQAPNVRTDASLLKVISGIFVAQQPIPQNIRKPDFCMALNNATFLLFMKHVNNLEELVIMNAQLITDEGFKLFPQHCPKLKALYLGYAGITQKSMELLGQHCRQLRKLTLSWCPRLAPSSLTTLDNCPLEDLTIRVDHSDGEHWMTINDTIPDLTRLLHLTHLCLSNCSTDFVRYLLATSDMDGYIPWPRLTRLDIAECCGLDDQDIVHFIKSHPALTSIDFPEDCVSNTTLDMMPSFLPNLKELSLCNNGRVTNQGMRRLIKNCPLLLYVYTSGCGILIKDFPEAGDHFTGDMFLDYLDETAIGKIRFRTDVLEGEHISQLDCVIHIGNDQSASGN